MQTKSALKLRVIMSMNTVSKYDVADILMHISADKVHNPGLEGPTNGVFAAILDKVEKNTTIEKVADKVADKVAESGMLPADNNLDMNFLESDLQSQMRSNPGMLDKIISQSDSDLLESDVEENEPQLTHVQNSLNLNKLIENISQKNQDVDIKEKSAIVTTLGKKRPVIVGSGYTFKEVKLDLDSDYDIGRLSELYSNQFADNKDNNKSKSINFPEKQDLPGIAVKIKNNDSVVNKDLISKSPSDISTNEILSEIDDIKNYSINSESKPNDKAFNTAQKVKAYSPDTPYYNSTFSQISDNDVTQQISNSSKSHKSALDTNQIVNDKSYRENIINKNMTAQNTVNDDIDKLTASEIIGAKLSVNIQGSNKNITENLSSKSSDTKNILNITKPSLININDDEPITSKSYDSEKNELAVSAKQALDLKKYSKTDILDGNSFKNKAHHLVNKDNGSPGKVEIEKALNNNSTFPRSNLPALKESSFTREVEFDTNRYIDNSKKNEFLINDKLTIKPLSNSQNISKQSMNFNIEVSIGAHNHSDDSHDVLTNVSLSTPSGQKKNDTFTKPVLISNFNTEMQSVIRQQLGGYQKGVSKITVTLYPESFGKVSVEVSYSENSGLKINMTGDNPEAIKILEQNLSSLRDSLQSDKISELIVDLNTKSNASNQDSNSKSNENKKSIDEVLNSNQLVDSKIDVSNDVAIIDLENGLDTYV